MHLQFIVPALLVAATQAAPNSYLEKAKAILARSNLPCFNWDGTSCGYTDQQPESPSLFGTPTEQDQAGDLDTAFQPVPAGVPEAFRFNDGTNPTPPQPVPGLLQQNPVPQKINPDDRPNPQPDNPKPDSNDQDSDDEKPPPPIAHCYDYRSTCHLCWTDEKTKKRVCKDIPKGTDGQVCSEEVDSNGKPYCATPAD